MCLCNIIIIIIMEIYKAPTLRLKVMNKHSIYYNRGTHNLHGDGNVINNKNVCKKEQEKKKKEKLTHM